MLKDFERWWQASGWKRRVEMYTGTKTFVPQEEIAARQAFVEGAMWQKRHRSGEGQEQFCDGCSHYHQGSRDCTLSAPNNCIRQAEDFYTPR